MAYFHYLQLRIAGHYIKLYAGFCDNLPVPALLGRYGFFDHFSVTFNARRRQMELLHVPPDEA